MSRVLALLLALCALVMPSIARAHARVDVCAPARASGGIEASAGSRVGSPDFLQKDPSGYADSPNLYAGLANDPVNLRDPTGLTSFEDCAQLYSDAFERLDCRLGRDVSDADAARMMELLQARGYEDWRPGISYPGPRGDWDAWNAWEDLRRWHHGQGFLEAMMSLPSVGPSLPYMAQVLASRMQAKTLKPAQLRAIEVGGGGASDRKEQEGRLPPFNPSNSMQNCVGSVCAFLNSVKAKRLVQATTEVWRNEGSITTALAHIRERTGATLSPRRFRQLNELRTTNEFQLFVVFRGHDAERSPHVAVGIVKNGRALIYDPQTGTTYHDPNSFGAFQAFGVKFNGDEP